jgi:single-stranded-DNA-specific exonuclease
MSQAVARLYGALIRDEKIIIIGDFDADGATSSALMMLAMRDMGFEHLNFLVPNRFDYGYGLTTEIVDLAQQYTPNLIVTVDNGISSNDGVNHAQELGVDVIITDHHLPGDCVPNAVAIINPNQPGCSFPSKSLAGVGVAFYLLSGLRAKLRDEGWFTNTSLTEPNLANWLDLVALGTVADVVPLDHINRIFVHQGLLRIRSGHSRPGIQALLQIAGKNPKRLTASDLGFAIGPRLNAAGRLDDIALGIQCLLTDDQKEALETAECLDQLNRDRKSIEQGMQLEAVVELDKLSIQSNEIPSALCLFKPDWHQGVVGLVASRLKEKYHRPVVAFARSDDRYLKGSCRSISGLHIRDALESLALRHPGLIVKFGGHAMAAGLTLEESCLENFTNAFREHVDSVVSADELNARIMTDGSLEAEQINMQTASMLREAGPWGQQFPEPSFQGIFKIKQQRIVGKNHLKLLLHLYSNPVYMFDAIYFNVDLDCWPAEKDQKVICVYRLEINEFRGQESLQLVIEHMAPEFV